MTRPPLRIGFMGLGLAARLVVESLLSDPRVSIVAGADPDISSHDWFAQGVEAAECYSSVVQMRETSLDAIWVTTPTRFHREHVVLAASTGADVIVEKPMAVTVEDCEAMIVAAEQSGVRLLAGGVRSLDPAFRQMRAVIESGRLGALRTVQTSAFTGWLARPRSSADLDVRLGGGLLFNQAPHQLDVVRFLAGGVRALSVRARAGAWSRARPGVGYYAADVELQGGVFASLTYDGYGRLSGDSMMPHEPCERCATERPWVPTDAGTVIAICEEGEILQAPHGLEIFTIDGCEAVEVPRGDVNTVAVDQLLGARDGHELEQSGRWGRDTQAAVVALVESAEMGKRIFIESCEFSIAFNSEDEVGSRHDASY